MKITFLGHSGYAVEISGLLLVFDYETSAPLDSDPAEAVFFVSHQPQDHFNPQIFSHGTPGGPGGLCAFQGYQEESPEDRRAGRAHPLYDGRKEDAWMRGTKPSRIRTLRSTDCGVAFSGGLREISDLSRR